jgi:hypothetical protein
MGWEIEDINEGKGICPECLKVEYFEDRPPIDSDDK